MEITLTRNAARKGDRLIYAMEGRPGSVQFTSKKLFNAVPPATLKIVGEFAPPPVKMTAEERKAARKAITPAERLAKLEQKIATMKAKLAAAPPATAAAPPKADVQKREQKGRR